VTDNANASNESGGFAHVAGEGLDVTHGVVLYLEDISVSFDGFRALKSCRCRSTSANCDASSVRTAPARPP